MYSIYHNNIIYVLFKYYIIVYIKLFGIYVLYTIIILSIS